MKACVDKNLCIGCGLCAAVSPDVFSMDDDGMSVAINENLEGKLLDEALDAKGQCPVSAIEVA